MCLQRVSNFSSTRSSLRTTRNTASNARRNAPVERKECVQRRAQPALSVGWRQPFPSNRRRADPCFVERAFRKWRDRSLWIWRIMKHEPIVLERTDWRVTKAACSCGAVLQLAGYIGTIKEQHQKLVAAFQKHKIEGESARQKPVRSALPKPTEMTPGEDVNHHPV